MISLKLVFIVENRFYLKQYQLIVDKKQSNCVSTYYIHDLLLDIDLIVLMRLFTIMIIR